MELTYNKLISKLHENKNLFMFIGHGSKNQFRYINDLKSVLKNILEKIPKNSAFYISVIHRFKKTRHRICI